MITKTWQDLLALKSVNKAQCNMKGFVMKFIKNVWREAEGLRSNMPEEGR